jgi:OOP family OmpA-OmpF porin
MKRFQILFLLLLSITIGKAQNADKKWAIGLGGGYYHNLDFGNSDGLMPEFYLSRYISPSFDVMLQSTAGFFLDTAKTQPDNVNLFLNLRYKLFNDKIMKVDSKIQPYIFAGAGFLSDNAVKGVNFDAGFGAKYMIKPNFALFAEAGYIHGINSTRTNNINGNSIEEPWHDNFIKAVVGIEICFGKAPDADRDGISDNKDKCPDTPLGVKVDKSGCALDSDGDGILDAVDKCPKVKGLVAFEGCPDTDGDGIVDNDDDCPTVKGLIQFKGCPDSDGDGITDSKDDCPMVAGSKVFNGCPDTDGDGIADKDDECPAVAGLKSAKGCPDTDGDGITDNDDACPTVFGIKMFKGCPDSDGDGVEDNSDACPNTPKGATVDSKGCPTDKDGDGVFDGIDKCPDVKGVMANAGCPLEESKVQWLKDIKVNSIFFATGNSEITADSKQRMEKLLRLMENNPEYNLNVFGFADPRGNPEANKALSMKRAKAAVQYLISKGIAANRFSTEALGEENSNKASLSEEELQNSRRVDFNLYK